jgi:hypothetical protein
VGCDRYSPARRQAALLILAINSLFSGKKRCIGPGGVMALGGLCGLVRPSALRRASEYPIAPRLPVSTVSPTAWPPRGIRMEAGPAGRRMSLVPTHSGHARPAGASLAELRESKWTAALGGRPGRNTKLAWAPSESWLARLFGYAIRVCCALDSVELVHLREAIF